MGSVGSSSAFHGLVDSDVFNDEIINIQSLGLGIGNSVLEKGENMSARLFGPSSLSKSPFFGLSTSSSATFVFGEGDTSSVIENFIQILFSFFNKHSTDGLSGLVGVLEVNSKVESVSAAGYKLVNV